MKILSFNKYLLRAHYVPGTALGSRNVALHKTVKIPWVNGAYILFKSMSLSTFWSVKNELSKVETSF